MSTPTLPCPDCGGELVLKQSRRGPFYGCRRFPECRGAHGAHADGAPKGVPGDLPTREARVRAHAAFDPLWQGGGMSRTAAYKWLAREMGRSIHMGSLSVAECEQVIALCAQRGAERHG